VVSESIEDFTKQETLVLACDAYLFFKLSDAVCLWEDEKYSEMRFV
jgi:hypothetical protein